MTKINTTDHTTGLIDSRARRFRRLGLILGLAPLLALVILAPPATAQFVVNVAWDASDYAPGNGDCDADPGPGFACTLRAALEENDALGGGTLISLLPLPDVFKLDPLFPGLFIATDVEIEGTGPFLPVIDGLGAAGRSVFSIDAGVVARFEFLQIQGGHADIGGGIANSGELLLEAVVVRDNHAEFHGGGIANFGTLEVRDDSEIVHNRALLDGGGVYTESGGGGILTVEASDIRENEAFNDGGGIFSTGAVVTLTDTVFDFNNAHRMGGGAAIEDGPAVLGALYVQAGTKFLENKAGMNGGGLQVATEIAAIDGALFEDNEAGIGGGIHAEFSQALAMHVTDSDFVSNSATSGGGMNTLRRAQLEDVLFSANEATSEGGGFRASGGEWQVVRRGEFVENVAQSGGAIFARADLALHDSNVHHNFVTGGGGGIYTWRGYLYMTGTTVAFNQIGEAVSSSFLSGAGGGILSFDGVISAKRVSVWGNIARSVGGGIYLEEAGPTSAHALVDLENTTVAMNEAQGGSGGGVLISSYRLGAKLHHSTITGNMSALEGAGIVFLGPSQPLELFSSIVADNVLSTTGAGSDCRGLVRSLGSNLVRNVPASCNYVAIPGSDLPPGTSPNFGIVSDPTVAGPGRAVVRLGLGSAAINASSSCPAQDQLHSMRVGACDMGAVEFWGVYREDECDRSLEPDDTSPGCVVTKEDPPTPHAGPACGLGFEFALVLGILMAFRRRRGTSLRSLSALLAAILGFGFFAVVPGSGADTFGGGTDYSGQDLSGQNFESADLFGADFSGADLTDASFFGAILTAVDFSGANLTRVEFRLADLTGADLSGSDLTDANWDQTTCPDGSTQVWNPETCGPRAMVGPAAPLPSSYPPIAGAIGWIPEDVAPAELFAVWPSSTVTVMVAVPFPSAAGVKESSPPSIVGSGIKALSEDAPVTVRD